MKGTLAVRWTLLSVPGLTPGRRSRGRNAPANPGLQHYYPTGTVRGIMTARMLRFSMDLGAAWLCSRAVSYIVLDVDF